MVYGFRHPDESKTKLGRFETTSEDGFRSLRFRSADSSASCGRKAEPYGRPNRTRPLRFRHEIGFVWTGPQLSVSRMCFIDMACLYPFNLCVNINIYT